MSKYIDRDALFNSLSNAKTVEEIFAAIQDAPAEDVEKVVRCKDCKWFDDIGCAIRIVDDSDRPSENDFCSFAERKDNG